MKNDNYIYIRKKYNIRYVEKCLVSQLKGKKSYYYYMGSDNLLIVFNIRADNIKEIVNW